VNIALVNELKLAYARWGLMWGRCSRPRKRAVWFSWRFIPGAGLGAIASDDPFYLTWKAREYGQPETHASLSGGREKEKINTSIPGHVVNPHRGGPLPYAQRKPLMEVRLGDGLGIQAGCG